MENKYPKLYNACQNISDNLGKVFDGSIFTFEERGVPPEAMIRVEFRIRKMAKPIRGVGSYVTHLNPAMETDVDINDNFSYSLFESALLTIAKGIINDK